MTVYGSSTVSGIQLPGTEDKKLLCILKKLLRSIVYMQHWQVQNPTKTNNM